MNRTFTQSLRFRLVALTLGVEIIMLSLLIGNSLRLVDQQVKQQLITERGNLNQLFLNSININLFERDYVTMESTLLNIIGSKLATNPILHIHVLDNAEEEFIYVGVHIDEIKSIQDDIASIDYDRPYLMHTSPIELGGVKIGSIRYILSIEQTVQFRNTLLHQAITIASIEILLSLTFLLMIGFWLTRDLDKLVSATKEIAKGNYKIDLQLNSHDEIGQLADSLHTMSREVNQRTEELQSRHDELSAIANYSSTCEIWINTDGQLEWVNPSASFLVGYSLEEIKSMPDFPLPLIHEDDREMVETSFRQSLNSKPKGCDDFRLIHKEGHEVWASSTCNTAFNQKGQVIGLRASIIDISERVAIDKSLKESLQQLERSHELQQQLLVSSQHEQARLRSLLTSMNIGILYENLDHEVDYYNPAFIRAWAIDESKICIGMKTKNVLQHSTNVISHPNHFSKHILDVESTHESSESFEIITTDGRTIHQLSYPVVDEINRFIGRIWMYEDVTLQKQTAEQLLYLAERDHLTGLYNRRRFQEELEQLIRKFERSQEKFALLFFDLDEFKLINDTFGHRAGDSVLIRIGGELSTLIRSDVFLSRLGGDEFGLLTPINIEADAETLANRIVQAISSLPFRFEGNNLRITTSIGIATYPRHGNNMEDLVAKADTAMYAAKIRGKNTSRMFEDSMLDSSSITKHLTWNERIIDALDNDKFVLHYQAVKNIQLDEISHYEMLIRMVDVKHPDKLIMPGNFIPVAEKSGKILKIDQWVVNQAILLLAKNKNIPSLAVNVSGRSLDEPTLAHNIARLLEKHKVSAQRLIIELTETAAVSDLADAQRFIEQMHRTGCKVYLDDFGAGFSTFSYLKHIDADSLKFDGQFIVNLSNDHENQIFVKSMVSIAKGLGKKTVAEFVEDADTLALLKEYGVDMAQGYFIHKPSPEML